MIFLSLINAPVYVDIWTRAFIREKTVARNKKEYLGVLYSKNMQISEAFYKVISSRVSGILMIKLILPQRWETCWPPKVYFYSVKEEILKFDNTLNLDFEFFQNVNLFFKLQTMFMIIALILYRWNMLLGRKLFQIFGFSRFYFQIEYWLNDRKKEYNYKIRYSWSFFSFQANVCCMLNVVRCTY